MGIGQGTPWMSWQLIAGPLLMAVAATQGAICTSGAILGFSILLKDTSTCIPVPPRGARIWAGDLLITSPPATAAPEAERQWKMKHSCSCSLFVDRKPTLELHTTHTVVCNSKELIKNMYIMSVFSSNNFYSSHVSVKIEWNTNYQLAENM